MYMTIFAIYNRICAPNVSYCTDSLSVMDIKHHKNHPKEKVFNCSSVICSKTFSRQKEGVAPPIFSQNWGQKTTIKLLTTGKKEGARTPTPPLNPPLQSPSSSVCLSMGDGFSWLLYLVAHRVLCMVQVMLVWVMWHGMARGWWLGHDLSRESRICLLPVHFNMTRPSPTLSSIWWFTDPQLAELSQ